jgi:hypothetical protein
VIPLPHPLFIIGFVPDVGLGSTVVFSKTERDQNRANNLSHGAMNRANNLSQGVMNRANNLLLGANNLSRWVMKSEASSPATARSNPAPAIVSADATSGPGTWF